MPRRIEIELTSKSADSWTWRQAGAKLPKGTLTNELVPPAAAVGDVMRAEVESGLDGLEIIQLEVIAPKEDAHKDERIEFLGAPRPAPNISVALAPGSRRRRDRDDEGPGRERSPDAKAPVGRARAERARAAPMVRARVLVGAKAADRANGAGSVRERHVAA